MRFQYKDGFLFCVRCGKQYHESICPEHHSKKQTYKICPVCVQKYKLRAKPHNKNSSKYYLDVIKPQLTKDRDVIVKWKQNKYSNSGDKQK